MYIYKFKYVFILFVYDVKTPFNFISTFLESSPHPSPQFTTQTFCITYNVITIMTFVLLIRNGHLEVVQILVNGKDTDPNAVNKDGKTALHLAAK